MSEIITPRPPLGCAAVMMSLFRAALHEHHLPVTHQRAAIAQTLFESGRHLSADDVAARLSAGGDYVGKATVYRTLSLLVDVGLAIEHDFVEGFKRYETRAGPAHHDHLICTSCGEVVEFHRGELDRIQGEVASTRGFHVITRQLKLYGLCAACDSEAAETLRRVG